jgi:hypothetical protein
MKREHRYDIISVPIALCWQFCMLMLPMQLIIREYQAAAITGGVLVAALIGLYFTWYSKLPPREQAG